MSEKQPALANLPPVPAWVVYLLLGLAGVGGGSGTLAALVQVLTPPPDVSDEVRVLREEVTSNARAVAETAESVQILNTALQEHVVLDASRDVAVADVQRRVSTLEANQSEVRKRLDAIRVNQLVICRTLNAPCGGD
jgi:hypothetical protein